MSMMQNEKGIGLVETIVALGISIVVLTSLVSLSLYTLRSSQQSKYMLEASKLATEELERVRAVRDGSTLWSVFKSTMTARGCFSSPCNITPALSIVSGTDTSSSNYIRSFKVSEPSLDVLRIAVTVSYTIGGQAKSVSNYTDLTNWRGTNERTNGTQRLHTY
jgi:Tfp pilus assembly protein PilV